MAGNRTIRKVEKNIKKTLKGPKRILIKKHLHGNEYNYKNLFHSSNVAVFPELEISFNRIKKSGNSTICYFLLELANSVAKANHAVTKDSLKSLDDLPLSEVKKFPEYFSFVVVREPYARSLSAFLQKMGKRQPESYKHIPGAGKDSPEGFLEYLRYLEDGGLSVEDRHFWPQVDLLYQKKERYSYVAKLENLVEDMREILVLNKIDPEYANELSAPHKTERDDKSRITSASKSRDAYYTEEAKAIVRRLYSGDFETFDYDPTF